MTNILWHCNYCEANIKTPADINLRYCPECGSDGSCVDIGIDEEVGDTLD